MPAVERKTDVSAAMIARIRRLRNARGWSERQLAEAMTAAGYPVTRSTLANWTRNTNPAVTADQIAAIATAFGIAIGELFGIGWCNFCLGSPPAGFTCSTCGAKTDTTTTTTGA